MIFNQNKFATHHNFYHIHEILKLKKIWLTNLISKTIRWLIKVVLSYYALISIGIITKYESYKKLIMSILAEGCIFKVIERDGKLFVIQRKFYSKNFMKR